MEVGKQKKKEKKNGESEGSFSMTKHYPWLLEFDSEVKERMTMPVLTNANVLKLLTMLESYISPEVSKLRTKPNRATKFLAAIQRRISMIKLGGYMLETESEKVLFPTYGLLMTHVVNITLNSSKIEKCGAQQVAHELYYFLKLMFQYDNEYVLDVILCSTIDEHATSVHKVGFQLFSSVMDDWRCYTETHSSLMKYCAVASLLSSSSSEGERIVGNSTPTDINKDFLKFLCKNLNIELKPIKKKSHSLASIIQVIKVTVVKSISRARLIVVSRKHLSKAGESTTADGDGDSDGESTSSTATACNNSREQPSSSSGLNVQRTSDTVSSFFKDVGLDAVTNWSLDIQGNRDVHGENGVSSNRERYYDDVISKPEESAVSSSSVATRRRVNFMKSRPQDSSDESHEEMEEDMKEMEEEMKEMKEEMEEVVEEEEEMNSFLDPSSTNAPEETNNVVETATVSVVNANVSTSSNRTLDLNAFEGAKENSTSQYTVQDEAVPGCSKDLKTDGDSDSDMVPLTRGSGTFSKLENQQLDGDSDSDLEILSVKDMDLTQRDGRNSASSPERDEAEPESGEDYVPNYKDDTDNSDGTEDLDDRNANGGSGYELAEGYGYDNPNSIFESMLTQPGDDIGIEDSLEIASSAAEALLPGTSMPKRNLSDSIETELATSQSNDSTPTKRVRLEENDGGNEDAESQASVQSLPLPTQRGRGRGRRSRNVLPPPPSSVPISTGARRSTRTRASTATTTMQEFFMDTDTETPPTTPVKRKARKSAPAPLADTAASDETVAEEIVKSATPSKRGRGRPPRGGKAGSRRT